MEFFSTIEQQWPGAFLQLGVGVLAALSRLAFDAQGCDRGWIGFAIMFSRQCVVAVTFVAVASGVTAYLSLDKPISISIILLTGFFAKEVVEQMQIIIKKAPCLLLRLKNKK